MTSDDVALQTGQIQTAINPALLDGSARKTPAQYQPLERVTRPNLKTEEAAYYLNRRPQTLRAWACLETGPIRPLRVGGLLAWPTEQIKALVGVAT